MAKGRYGEAISNLETAVSLYKGERDKLTDVLFELAGGSDTLAREAMRLAAAKVGIRTVMVSRNAKA